MSRESDPVQISIKDLITGEEGELLGEMTGEATFNKAEGSFDEIKLKIESLGFEVSKHSEGGSVTTWRVHKPGERNIFRFIFTLWSEDADGVTWIPEEQFKQYQELLSV